MARSRSTFLFIAPRRAPWENEDGVVFRDYSSISIARSRFDQGTESLNSFY